MKQFLPREDWLKQAQSLAVGQKRRIRHGFERTAALDVYNNDDSWSAYCHRCHTSGRVMKQHQTMRRVVEPDRVAPVPATCSRLADASRYEQQRVWELLVHKGCPPGVIPEEVMWYSTEVDRLVLRSGQIALGRALSVMRSPKWLPYGAWKGLPMVWQTRSGVGATVLVEDALSGYKVAKAIDTFAPQSSVRVIATLGTSITDRFLPYLTGVPVLCMYDGDKAGHDGYLAMRQRLAVWGQPVLDRRPTKGDPKNMTLEAVFNSVEDFV